ncbi:Branched-chain amino acid transport, AzlD [Burkholderiales bacterium]
MTELLALTGAVLGTYLWRALGVSFSGRINTTSEVFRWVACITYAMVAGLTLRILLLPVGPLAQLSMEARLLAAGLAFAVMVWPNTRWGGLVPGLLTGSLVILVASLV